MRIARELLESILDHIFISERDRTYYYLRHCEGLSYQAISKHLKVTTGALYAVENRVRKRLGEAQADWEAAQLAWLERCGERAWAEMDRREQVAQVLGAMRTSRTDPPTPMVNERGCRVGDRGPVVNVDDVVGRRWRSKAAEKELKARAEEEQRQAARAKPKPRKPSRRRKTKKTGS
jgi:hypothetical protein